MRRVINGINSSTTPEQFDELCNQNPDYHLEDGCTIEDYFGRPIGFTALIKACDVGSPELVEHIAKKNLKFLDQQDQLGETALWKSLHTKVHDDADQERRFKIAKIMLNLGANPNIPDSHKTSLLKNAIDVAVFVKSEA